MASRFCRFCKKSFCCTECRDRHVDSVHPDLNANCVLCSSELLPMRQFEFDKLSLENEKLSCHIVEKHLPLHCILCGELFATEENFKSLGACKWYSERHQFLSCERLSLPRTPALADLQVKLKHCTSDSNYSSKTFFTPPEIYRNTSTPMFASQISGFEYQTPCAPNFSLKTPTTNSLSIARDNATSNIHESQESDNANFLSFTPHTISLGNEETPFRTNNDEQFPRNNSGNSGRKLDIKKGPDETAENEQITYKDQVASPTDMDLTDPLEGGLLHDSSKLEVIHEEPDEASSVVKKVRFSNRFNETLPKFENQMSLESCVKTILNTTEEEEFHDAHDLLNTKNMKDTKDIDDTKNVAKDAKIMDNIEDTKDGRAKAQKYSLVNTSKNSLENSQIKLFQDNKENMKKENQNAEILPNSLSINQQGTSRVLMMVLLENNSGGLNADLMPLISSGLKKLKEQAESAFSNMTESSNAANSNSYTRKSITKMEMSVSNVESYTKDNAEIMTDHRQIIPSSSSSVSSSSVQNGKNSSNGGILSAVAQAVKYAFSNFSGRQKCTNSSNIERTQIIQRREIVEESTSLTESATPGTSSNLNNNLEIRPGKRTRDVTEVTSSWTDPIAHPLDTRSPLAKRQKGWSKIKARQPISRMRNNGNRVTSPRGVSSETQIFSQGSLTVGDTVLPLPARAHQFTQTDNE